MAGAAFSDTVSYTVLFQLTDLVKHICNPNSKLEIGTLNFINKVTRTIFLEENWRLRQSNVSNWWRQTKKVTGQVSKPDLVGLANESMHRLVNSINASLIKVSADLNRLTAATPTDQYVNNKSITNRWCWVCLRLWNHCWNRVQQTGTY